MVLVYDNFKKIIFCFFLVVDNLFNDFVFILVIIYLSFFFFLVLGMVVNLLNVYGC